MTFHDLISRKDLKGKTDSGEATSLRSISPGEETAAAAAGTREERRDICVALMDITVMTLHHLILVLPFIQAFLQLFLAFVAQFPIIQFLCQQLETFS